MKKLVSLVAVLAVVSSPAFAAPKKKTTVKTTTTTTETTTSSAKAAAPSETTTSSRTYTSTSDTKNYGPGWSGDAGLGSAGNKFTFGVGVRYERPVQLDRNVFKVGGRTGFFFSPSDPTSWFIPLAASGTYELKQEGAIKPYIGIDLGVAIYHQSSTNIDLSTGNVTGSTNIRFLGLFRPGAHFGEKYYAELPVGIIGSDFAILPCVGMHF